MGPPAGGWGAAAGGREEGPAPSGWHPEVPGTGEEQGWGPTAPQVTGSWPHPATAAQAKGEELLREGLLEVGGGQGGPDRHHSAGRAARRPQQPVGRHQGAVSLRCPHPVLVEPSVRRAPASPRARTEGEQRGKPSCSYHWPCSLRKIPEMKTTDARVREEQGCSTARPHIPAGRRGPGKGDPGMRCESPRALLPGSPKKQAEVLRDAPPGHPRSGVRISGSAVPAACAVSPAWVPCRGAGGSGDRTMEEKAGARESGPVA